MRGSAATLAVLGLLLAGCASKPSEPDVAERAAYVETTAVVEAVSAEHREIMLRTEDERLLTVVAGPEVRNFDQIDVGDTVKAGYLESVALTMAEPSGPDRDETAAVAQRAREGAKPGIAIAEETLVTVEIVSYDADTGIVTFEMPDGRTHSLEVAPEMRDVASRRQPGDRVDLRFTTAIAMLVVATP